MALPRVHAEGDARDLREAARNGGQPRHAELQRIQQHLPGDPDRDHIAGVGQDVQDVVVRDRAGFQVVAHGTGIDQRRLRAAPGPEGIRHQLAQPVFLDAADVKAVCIPDDHVVGHFADLPLHDRGVRGDDLVQKGLHLRVHTALGIVPGDGLEGEVRRRGHAVDQGLLHAAVLVDLDLPDGSQIHARLGHGDLPPLSVGDGMAEGLMGMAVDDQIQPGQPSNDRIGTKLLRDRVVAAEVRNEDHIVRPGLTHLIDGLLQPRAQPVSRLVGQKVVHRLAGLVQNVLDDGFGKGIRRDRADKADLQVAGLQNAPGLKHRLAARDAEIGAGIAAGQLLRAAVQHLDPVVELMVARHGEVVAEAVHHFDDLGAFRDSPDGRTLDGVAGIDQQNVVIDLLELFLIQCQAVVADVVLKRHMHVVGVQDHRGDLIGIIGQPGICVRNRGRHHDPSLRLPVILRDDAAQILFEVLHDHLVVGQPRHAEDIRLFEHAVAVTAAHREAAARNGILRLRVEGLLPDHDIGNPVFPGHRDKLALFVNDDAALQVRVHAECDPRDLREASETGRQPRHAEFQRVQQRLSGKADSYDVVGIGQEVQNVVVRDRAGFQIVPYRRGIDEGDLGAADSPVGIRHKIAQPVFLNPAVDAVSVHDHVIGYLADFPLHDRRIRGDDPVQKGFHLRVHTALDPAPGDGLKGDVRRRGHTVDQGLLEAAVLVDLDLAEGFQTCSRLRDGDLPALSVGDGTAVGEMGMAFDDQVQTGQPSHHRVTLKPLCDDIAVAEVRHEDHTVRPGLTHLIDGLLQPRAQPVSRLVGQKVVHRLADLVQDVF